MVLLRRTRSDDSGAPPAFDPALDAYGVMQLRPAASRGLIDRAYWLHAQQLRAARGGGEPAAGALLEALNGAYAILADHDSRAAYDRLRGYRPTAAMDFKRGGRRWLRRAAETFRGGEDDWSSTLHVAAEASTALVEIAYAERRIAARSMGERRSIDAAHAAARQGGGSVRAAESYVLEPAWSPAAGQSGSTAMEDRMRALGAAEAMPAAPEDAGEIAAAQAIAQSAPEGAHPLALDADDPDGAFSWRSARPEDDHVSAAIPGVEPQGETPSSPALEKAPEDGSEMAAAPEEASRPRGFGRAVMRVLGGSRIGDAERSGPASARIDRALQAVEAAQNRILALREEPEPVSSGPHDAGEDAGPSIPELCVVSGRGVGKRIPLLGGSVSVGFSEDAGIFAPASTQNESFRIWQRGEHFLLRVADDATVRLNGEGLTNVAILEDGDEIEVEGELLQFRAPMPG